MPSHTMQNIEHQIGSLMWYIIIFFWEFLFSTMSQWKSIWIFFYKSKPVTFGFLELHKYSAKTIQYYIDINDVLEKGGNGWSLEDRCKIACLAGIASAIKQQEQRVVGCSAAGALSPSSPSSYSTPQPRPSPRWGSWPGCLALLHWLHLPRPQPPHHCTNPANAPPLISEPLNTPLTIIYFYSQPIAALLHATFRQTGWTVSTTTRRL